MTYKFRCGARDLNLSSAIVMGVLNVTPDSFSDGGRLYKNGALHLDSALNKARVMVAAGAKIIDVGGESTRPGAKTVGVQEELDRVVPLVELIAKELDVVVSVDTSSAPVILQTAKVGAGLINDVRALTGDGALQAAADSGLPVCLMHMQGTPADMQDNPSYVDVVAGVKNYLAARIEAAKAAGIEADQIMVDPGFGFGKTAQHNLMLLKHLSELSGLACPILVGLSRKSLIGHVLGRDVDERLAGSLSLALMALTKGAAVIRVHDVQETVDAIALWQAVHNS